jgi:hypothetical protein
MVEEQFDADAVLRDLDEEIPLVEDEDREPTEEELKEIDFEVHHGDVLTEDDGEWE